MSTHGPYTWQSSSRTDVGTVREVNEDSLLARPEVGLWAVADGMGGHSAGALASESIVATLTDVLPPPSLSEFTREVEQRLVSVNTHLREMANREEVHTIGSTVVALLAHERHCVCQWAGDSRIYRFRDDALEQLTQDHALVEELIEKGILTPEEAAGHPQSNLVTRAIGASEQLYVDAEIFDLAHDDCFVLCSDGLDKELSAEDIAEIVATQPIHRMSDALVDLAVERGARDNVTAVCVQVSASDPVGTTI